MIRSHDLYVVIHAISPCIGLRRAEDSELRTSAESVFSDPGNTVWNSDGVKIPSAFKRRIADLRNRIRNDKGRQANTEPEGAVPYFSDALFQNGLIES